jgi:hypothetical protein
VGATDDAHHSHKWSTHDFVRDQLISRCRRLGRRPVRRSTSPDPDLAIDLTARDRHVNRDVGLKVTLRSTVRAHPTCGHAASDRAGFD